MPMIKCADCGEEYYLPAPITGDFGSITAGKIIETEHKEKCFRKMVKCLLLRIIELLEQKK